MLGIEKNQLLARLAGQVVPVVQGDFLEDYSEDEKFDVIILDRILNSKGEEILEKAASILKTGGQLLAAVSNAQCIKERKSITRKAGKAAFDIFFFVFCYDAY